MMEELYAKAIQAIEENKDPLKWAFFCSFTTLQKLYEDYRIKHAKLWADTPDTIYTFKAGPYRIYPTETEFVEDNTAKLELLNPFNTKEN